jgi:hypothetical protein
MKVTVIAVFLGTASKLKIYIILEDDLMHRILFLKKLINGYISY